MKKRRMALSDAVFERLSVPTAGASVSGNRGADETALRNLQKNGSGVSRV